MIYEMFNYLYVLSADITSSTGYGLGPGGYLLFMIVGVIFELVIFGVYYTFRSLGLYKKAKSGQFICLHGYLVRRAVKPGSGARSYCAKIRSRSLCSFYNCISLIHRLCICLQCCGFLLQDSRDH